MYDYPTNPPRGTFVTVPDNSYREWDGQKWKAVPSAYTLIPQERTADVANVLDYGADPTGAADSSSAINNALATGKIVWAPRGTYLVRFAINCGPGSVLFGDGRGISTIFVDQTFDPSARGVITLTGREEQSPIVRNFSIKFQQPTDQASRANYRTLAAGGTSGPGGTGVKYPPAIFSVNSNRFQIFGMQFYAAWDGIWSDNGCGFIDQIEMGALDIGLHLGQSRDFVHVSHYHFWSFGIVGPPSGIWSVFTDGSTVALDIGSAGGVNGGNFVDITLFCGRFKITDPGTFMTIANLESGDGATVEISGGAWIQIANSYILGTADGSNTNSVYTQTGGLVLLSNVNFGSTGHAPITQSAGVLHISGCEIGSNGFPNIPAIVQTGGQLYLFSSRIQVNDAGFGAWTAPIISSSGGATTFHMVGCRFAPTFSGSQPGITIASDNADNYVAGNDFNGWPFTAPGTAGFYSYNTDNKIYGPIHFVQSNVFVDTTLIANQAAINAPPSSDRNLFWQSSGSSRWNLFATNSGESGGNAGSDLWLSSFADAGTPLTTPIKITRATGQVDFAVRPTVAGVPVTLAVAVPVSGSHGDNPALVSLLTALASAGWITNETTA